MASTDVAEQQHGVEPPSTPPAVTFPATNVPTFSDGSPTADATTAKLLHGSATSACSVDVAVLGVPVELVSEAKEQGAAVAIPAARVAASPQPKRGCCSRTRCAVATCAVVVGTAAIVVIMAATGYGAFAQPAWMEVDDVYPSCQANDVGEAGEPTFAPAGSCAALSTMMRKGSCGQWYGAWRWSGQYGYPVADAHASPASGQASAPTPEAVGGAASAPTPPNNAYTGTNNQVQGVDEGDIVKAGPDGRHVFTISDEQRYSAYWSRPSRRPGFPTLVITMVVPEAGGEVGVVSSTDLSKFLPLGAKAMFVNRDRAVVIGVSSYTVTTLVPAPAKQYEPNLRGGLSDIRRDDNGEYGWGPANVMVPVRHAFQTMTVIVLDVSNLAAPQVIRRVDLEGSYVTARMVGDAVHIVSAAPPHAYAYAQADADMTPTALLPLYREVLNATQSQLEAEWGVGTPDDYVGLPPPPMHDSAFPGDANVGYTFPSGFKAAASCSDVMRASTLNPDTFVSVTTVPIGPDDDALEAGNTVVASAGSDNVFVSERAIYVAGSTHAQGDPRTVIMQFDLPVNPVAVYGTPPIDNGIAVARNAVEFAGGFSAPGSLLNQFSMDEHNGYFRVATTTVEQPTQPQGVWSAAPRRVRMNNMFVFAQRRMMTQADGSVVVGRPMVGELGGVAPGEDIKSVRFMGTKALMVTFRTVDPLFVIDLADPASPTVLGSVKLPGYSEYLHPINSTHIIGLGRDVTVVPRNGGGDARPVTQGLKLVMFDISDVAAPRVAYNTVIGHRGTESEALQEHKAFFYDSVRGMVVLPVSLSLIQGARQGDWNPWWTGQPVFQGALAYRVTDDGFALLATISHDSPSGEGGIREEQRVRRTVLMPPVAEIGANENQAADADDVAEPAAGDDAVVARFDVAAPGTLVTVSRGMLLSMRLPDMHALAAVHTSS